MKNTNFDNKIINEFYDLNANSNADASGVGINEKNEKSQKQGVAELLIKDIQDLEVFHSEHKEPYIIVPISNHKEVMKVTGDSFKRWLSKRCWDRFHQVVKTATLKEVENIIAANAVYEGLENKLKLRVAGNDEVIYYDLCNSTWQVIKIDNTGWSILDDSPVFFKRHPSQVEQVIPINGT